MAVIDTNQNVISRIQDVQGMVDTAVSGAEAFLANLHEIANIEPPPINPPIGMFTPAMPDIDAPEPEHPTAADDILSGTGATEPEAPAVASEIAVSFPSDLDNITIPSASDFTFTEQAYLSDLLNALKSQLTTDIQTGGTGLTPEVENAIWRRDEERLRIARDEAVEDTLDVWSTRGLSMPDGALNEAVEGINEKYAAERSTKSHDVTIKSLDLALQNKWKAIESAIGLEGILIAHHDRVLDRALQAARSVLDVGIAILDAQIRRALGKIEIVKGELDARIAVEKFKLDKYATQITAYAKRVDATIARANAYINIYGADIQKYSAVLGKAEAVARILTQQGDIAARSLEASLQLALRAAETNLQAFLQAAQIRIAAASAGANVYAAQVGAAQNSLSTVIQLAASGETIATETAG